MTTTMVSRVGDQHDDLTQQERDAGFYVDQLKQLVGLVEYDEAKDVFPVTGWDAIVFVVGNATQTAHYYQSAWGMQLVAYRGPETGHRDHKSYVLESGSIRFVVNGAVDPDSPHADHHRRHGDGVIDIALEVPDSSDEAAYVPDLEAAGYVLVIREPGWYQHRCLRGPDTVVNLHVYSPGCPEIERYLLFRERLRAHPDERARYQRVKRELAERDWTYVQEYADAKTEVVEGIIARARAAT